MSIESHLDELFGALDPLTEDQRIDNELRRDAVWMDVVSRVDATRVNVRRRTRRRRLLGVGSLTAVVAGARPGRCFARYRTVERRRRRPHGRRSR